jgi:hypothetical protein
VIRAGLIRLGASVLEDLLAADPGHAGPRADCGCGHRAETVSRRDKMAGTVLGRVALRRAWYHCTACGHGFAPRDAQLGIAGQGMSAGLRKMTARAAAAVPFAAAARLAGELAGITLTGKRAGRRAEAGGNAAAARISAGAGAAAAGRLGVLPPAGQSEDADAGRVLDHGQDVGLRAAGRVDCEEVAGQDRLGLGAQEL